MAKNFSAVLLFLSLNYCTIINKDIVIVDNCEAATLSEIRDDVRLQIGDSSSNASNRRWGPTLLNFRINEIQNNICEKTRCIITRISTPTVSGQREYTYPADIVAPIRLAYVISNSSPPAYKALTRYSIAGLDNENASWESSPSGLPTKYYERGQKYGLQPIPSSVYASTYALQIDYYCRASSLTADGDVPFNGDVLLTPYHKLLILGTVIWCRSDMGLNSSDLKMEYEYLLESLYNAVRQRDDKKDWINIPFK